MADSIRKRTCWAMTTAVIVGCMLIGPLLSACGGGGGNGGGGAVPGNLPDISLKAEEPVGIDIVCVGDCMVHKSQLTAAASSSSPDGYDFENVFQYVKPYIEEADLALCNVETTFAGAPYQGYPAFSSPDSFAQALSLCGFDVAMTANNHMYDKGFNGILRTLEVLHAYGFTTTGSRSDVSQPRYAMEEVNGVNVAVVAYTYETPTSASSRWVALNGSRVSEEAAALINSFSYDWIDTCLAEINDSVNAARSAGADIVILYMHWGEEYQQTANYWERYLEEKIASDMDVDVLFGSHPHNLQEMEYYGDLPVYFSLGNFISNQRTETLGASYWATEIGCIAQVHIDIMESTGEITGTEMNAVPTWVEKYNKNGAVVYGIIPLDSQLEANPMVNESGHLARAQQARDNGWKLLNSQPKQ